MATPRVRSLALVFLFASAGVISPQGSLACARFFVCICRCHFSPGFARLRSRYPGLILVLALRASVEIKYLNNIKIFYFLI